MSLKDLISQYSDLYKVNEGLENQLLENQKLLTKLENDIKHQMVDQGLSSFESDGFGQFSIIDKITFEVPAVDKPKMIQYFKGDPELKELVKVKEDVNYQSAQKIFRDMYNEENKVPDFVKVSAFQLLDFKPIKK